MLICFHPHNLQMLSPINFSPDMLCCRLIGPWAFFMGFLSSWGSVCSVGRCQLYQAILSQCGSRVAGLKYTTSATKESKQPSPVQHMNTNAEPPADQGEKKRKKEKTTPMCLLSNPKTLAPSSNVFRFLNPIS